MLYIILLYIIIYYYIILLLYIILYTILFLLLIYLLFPPIFLPIFSSSQYSLPSFPSSPSQSIPHLLFLFLFSSFFQSILSFLFQSSSSPNLSPLPLFPSSFSSFPPNLLFYLSSLPSSQHPLHLFPTSSSHSSLPLQSSSFQSIRVGIWISLFILSSNNPIYLFQIRGVLVFRSDCKVFVSIFGNSGSGLCFERLKVDVVFGSGLVLTSGVILYYILYIYIYYILYITHILLYLILYYTLLFF